MAWKSLLIALGLAGASHSASATWPSSYDELEDIMLLNQGYNARQLSIPVTPCNFPAAPGRIPAAGFVRTAFHDVAPHNAALGTGGLDASIAFELAGEPGLDNAGPAFNNTLTFLQRFYSTQASMSDLIALALYTGVRGCGGPAVPVRTGRKDAVSAGALGVPKVNDTQQGFQGVFGRMGFGREDMIKMVACGHTLGGVHGQQFPHIVPLGTRTNDVANFDNTSSTFDNSVLADFVSNKSVNPLVVGPRDTASDAKVFSADGGLTIRQMADAQTFRNTCKDILQRMIDVVPSNVRLTEPIQVYEIKPGSLQLTLSADGKSLGFTGEIRVRTTSRPQSSIGSVTLAYKDRTGGKGSTISTTVAGTASGYDDSFTFYRFSADIDAETSISSFDVTITGSDGSSIIFNNNGHSFPVQDVIFLQRPSCSLGSPDASGLQPVDVVAAVRGSAKDVSLSVDLQTSRDVPLPLITTKPVSLYPQSTVGDYTFYKGSFSITALQINSTTLDLACQSTGQEYIESFKRLVGFGNLPSTGDSASTTSSLTSTEPSSYTVTTTLSDRSTTKSDAGSKPTATGSGPIYSTALTGYCGAEAGCNAEPWAQSPTWAVGTPGEGQHTAPAGIWTSKPFYSISSYAAIPGPTTSTSSSNPAYVATYNATASGPSIANFTGVAHKLGFSTFGGSIVAGGVISLLV